MKCAPKISNEAAVLLQNYYTADRRQVSENKTQSKKKNSIPVTVRQLEAIIRLSESIAKMSLAQVVVAAHVKEAHRLFQVSTLDTAKAGLTTDRNVPPHLVPLIKKIEETVKRRYPIGCKVSHTKLQEEISLLFSNTIATDYAINMLIKTGEFEYMEGKKIMIRKK